MILFDMNYPTIFHKMESEKEKLNFALQKNLRKVTTFKQGRYIPNNIFYDTVTLKDSGNTYLLYWHIPNFEAFWYDDYKSREKNMINGAMLLTKDKQGQQYGIVCKWYKTQREAGDQIKLMDGLNIFTPHFFSRYRERMNLQQNLSTMDLIAYFAARNLNYFVSLDYNRIVLEKDRQENGNATAIKDGLMLGEEEWLTVDGKPLMVVKAKTFISKNEFKEDQAKMNPSKEYVWNMAREMFENFNGYKFKD